MPFIIQKSCTCHWLSYLPTMVNIVPFAKFILRFVSCIQKTLQYLSIANVLWKDSGIFILLQTKDIQQLKQDLLSALQTLLEKQSLKHFHYNTGSEP